MIKTTSILKHIRDILILPFTVTCIVPYFIYEPKESFLPDTILVNMFGVLFIISGIFLFGYTVFLFSSIGKGTLAPWSSKQNLVVVGPYKYCRNPMISGVLFILIGEGLLFDSTEILIWATCFFVINTIYFIASEEPKLETQFGDEYRYYKKQVPRWIPRMTAFRCETN